MAVLEGKMTDAGVAKISRIIEAVRRESEAAAAFGVLELRRLAAANAPSPQEEAELLSRGVAQDGRNAGQTVGDPLDGRFLREGENISLREAIATDPVQQSTLSGGVLVAGTGSTSRINRLTGFSWRTRMSGTRGPTQPFNRAYVQAVENGGAYWMVTPREAEGSRVLVPETGVKTMEMIKTMRPYGMFRKARAEGRPLVLEGVRERLRDAAARASRQ
jgi:hypothetical protein